MAQKSDTEVERGNTKARSFLLTINNPREDDKKNLEECGSDYLIFQLEKGEQGTEHYQAFLYFKNARSFASIKKKFPRAHIERARNAKASIKYCSKEDTRVEGPWEFGDKPSQGQRHDLEEIQELIQKKTPMKEIADEYFGTWLRNYRAFDRYNSMYEERRDPKGEECIVHYLWGDAGCGKTHTAYEMLEGKDYYEWNCSKWWDGYCGQKYVLIDDYRVQYWDPGYILKVLHKFPHRVEYKGGACQLLAKFFIITSNIRPEENCMEKDITPWMRRLTYIKHFTKKA